MPLTATRWKAALLVSLLPLLLANAWGAPKLRFVVPESGETNSLGLAIEKEGLNGQIFLRLPETLHSSLGLVFIDHERADMRPAAPLEYKPETGREGATGAVHYQAKSELGVAFAAKATPAPDGVFVEFSVTNETVQPVGHVLPQFCLLLSQAPAFGPSHTLKRMGAWIGGAYTPLTSTTPTPEQKGREPWILLPTGGFRAQYAGPREMANAWWMVDQDADSPLIARAGEDGNHMVAIAWNEPDTMLMTNATIPCLHAGPFQPVDIEPGATHTWRGKVYLCENDPARLNAQFLVDQANGFQPHDYQVSRKAPRDAGQTEPGPGEPDAEPPASIARNSAGTIRVAAVRVVWQPGQESPESILERGLAIAAEGVAQGARYLVFPENFLFSNDPEEQRIPGPLTEKLEQFCKTHQVYACAGMVESWKFPWRDSHDTYLSAVMVGPDGYLSKHRKVDVGMFAYNRMWEPGMPKTDMDAWAGNDFQMHRWGAVERLAVMICRDTNSSWAWTRVLTQNPQIIASPNLRDSVTLYGADFAAMARKAGVPIVVATGFPKSESMIIDRTGKVLCLENEKERALVADVALAPDDPALRSFDVILNTAIAVPDH